MAKDLKYGEVSMERGGIPTDEPVWVLRGRDKTSIATLKAYRVLCEMAGSPERHLEMIDANIAVIRRFQEDHPDRVQVPASNGTTTVTTAAAPEYVSVPVTVTAVQWTGSNADEVAVVVGDDSMEVISDVLWVRLSTGQFRVRPGFWVARCGDGELMVVSEHAWGLHGFAVPE
jgi:hypothetical protein